jgi:hypothetical protein
MAKLKENGIILMHRSTWDLKEGQKYRVNKVFKDRNENEVYQFMSTRKNATTKINLYVDDIDREINDKTSSQVTAQIEFLFAKAIFIVR